MGGTELLIENEEHFTTSLNAISLAEMVVSHLIGGGSARAIAIRLISEDERDERGLPNSTPPTWCIHRGEFSYGIDISKLLPCETPLMRSRSLFEVARKVKEGVERRRLPAGSWTFDGVLEETSQIVSVTSGLGEILIGVERTEGNELENKTLLERESEKVVALPMIVSLKDWGALKEWVGTLATLQGPLSLITKGAVSVIVQQEFYTLTNDLIHGGVIMQRAENELQDKKVKDEKVRVLGGSEEEGEGDTPILLSVHLGEIQLKLSQLAKLRKGHSLHLTRENLSSEGGFCCTLTLGSTGIATGNLRFSGDRVVLTIAEVL